MPVGPRHTPSLISGAELCPHPEINPAPMVNGHELTLIVQFLATLVALHFTPVSE